MPILLEDLAEETAASYRRVAVRFDAVGRELDGRPQLEAELEQRRQRSVEAAREATEYVLAQWPQGKGHWEWTLAKLRKRPSEEDAMRILRGFRSLCEAVHATAESVRNLWKIAAKSGATPDPLDKLDQADAWFKDRVDDTKRAIDHRLHPWQPSDPERFTQGLKLAREGKTIKAEEARAWFSRTRG